MVEYGRQPAEFELEQALSELAQCLVFPATPELAATVRSRLTVPVPPRRGWLAAVSLKRGLAFAVLVLLLLVAAIGVLSPAARSAVADRLGLKGVRITVVATLPPPARAPATPAGALPAAVGSPVLPATGAAATPLPAIVATPATPGAALALGDPVTLAQAQTQLTHPLLVPSLPELGEPDAVYLQQNVPGGEVSLLYGVRDGLPKTAQPGVGLLVSEFRGEIEPAFFGKVLPAGTRLEPVVVNGGRGWWIEGAPHLIFYRDASGQVHDEQLRLAGNTLLWEQDGLTLRLESALTKDAALRIAASVTTRP